MNLFALGEEKGHLKNIFVKHKTLNIKKILSQFALVQVAQEIPSEVYKKIIEQGEENEVDLDQLETICR